MWNDFHPNIRVTCLVEIIQFFLGFSARLLYLGFGRVILNHIRQAGVQDDQSHSGAIDYFPPINFDRDLCGINLFQRFVRLEIDATRVLRNFLAVTDSISCQKSCRLHFHNRFFAAEPCFVLAKSSLWFNRKFALYCSLHRSNMFSVIEITCQHYCRALGWRGKCQGKAHKFICFPEMSIFS